jgi:uncharacterized membrane protein
MALVTIAVPLQLRLYGIPIAWALEGLLLAYIGTKYGKWTVQLGAVAALVLAAGGLVYRLPLHSLPFTPVFNVAFGSWVVVIGCAAGAAWLFRTSPLRPLGVVLGLLAYGLASLLLTLETIAFWDYGVVADRATHRFSSLVVLWAGISGASVYAIIRGKAFRFLPVAYLAFGIATLFMFAGWVSYGVPSHVLLLNSTFLPKLVLVLVLWWAGGALGRGEGRVEGHVLAVMGHAMLALLLAFELQRWAQAANVISRSMAVGLLSAVWAVQALVLVWLGLIWRDLLRRGMGLTLFGIIVLKVFIFDTAELSEVYRILSYILSGLVLLLGAYVYQRFSKELLADEPEKEGTA